MMDEELKTKIDRLLQDWHDLILKPGKTNRRQACHAIKRLYRLYNKSEAHIVFLESPYQMAVIPPLLANIIESHEWESLYQKRKSADFDFEREWLSLKELFDELDEAIISCPDLRWIDERVKENTRSRLKEIMREIVSSDAIAPGAFLRDNPNKSTKPCRLGKFLTSSNDIEFEKRLFALRDKISGNGSRSANLSLEIGFGSTALAIKADDLKALFSPESAHRSEQLAELKFQCSAFEQFAMAMMGWSVLIPSVDLPSDSVFPGGAIQFLDTIGRLLRNDLVLLERALILNRANILLPQMAWFLPFALAGRFMYPDFYAELQDEIDLWALLCHSVGACQFAEKVCFVCAKPNFFNVDNGRRPHNDNGPVCTWTDDFSVYAWHGLIIDPDWIRHKRSVDIAGINAQSNVELRRVMIEIFGEGRYIEESGARLVQEDECGKLYIIELPGDEPIVMVKVRNSTPEADGNFKDYYLRVPPEMGSAREAVAWTFDMSSYEYAPAEES